MPNSSQSGKVTGSSGMPSLFNPTINSLNTRLFAWGLNHFELQPFNVHEYDHETASDWAHKEIAGAPVYREWVGENDEIFSFRGRVFPYRIGGMGSLQQWEASRLAGQANALVRGDGQVMGWFVCEKLVRAHTYLSSEGIGQQIAFETTLVRVPVPGADGFLQTMWTTTGAGG
jgi:phage protein U